MLDALLFSKNRSCQADALLTGLAANCPGLFRVTVLWTASTPAFAKGYVRLAELHPGAEFVFETGPVKDHLLAALRESSGRSGTLTLFTDDCCWFRPLGVTPGDVLGLLGDDLVNGVSFRLGLNTTLQDYQTGREQPPLRPPAGTTVEPGTFVKWDQREYDLHDNYGYAGAQDGVLYRAGDLLEVVGSFEVLERFRDLEGAMHLPPRRDAWLGRRPMMCAPARSCVVNVPLNSVQADPVRAGVFHPRDTHSLNEAFLSGKRLRYLIDPEAVRGAHGEYPTELN